MVRTKVDWSKVKINSDFKTETEKLRKENAKMREALEKIADDDNWSFGDDPGIDLWNGLDDPVSIARQALRKDE